MIHVITVKPPPVLGVVVGNTPQPLSIPTIKLIAI